MMFPSQRPSNFGHTCTFIPLLCPQFRNVWATAPCLTDVCNIVSLIRISPVHPNYPTCNAIRAQEMRSLHSSTGRASIQGCDILQRLARHESRSSLPVGCLLFGNSSQYSFPKPLQNGRYETNSYGGWNED